MSNAVRFDSPYYPYELVMPGYNRYAEAEKMPNKIIQYLLDLPDAAGYEPMDDNNRPRVRLMKYLWYDGARPLDNALPTTEQKLSLLYNGDNPVLNTDAEKAAHPKGYRIFPQAYWLPAEFTATTLMKVYMGRNLPYSPFSSELGIVFEFLVNYGQDNNMKTNAASRLYAMECALLDALHGVNITGIGVVNFDRRSHMDSGSNYFHDDGTNLGRRVYLSVQWAESDGGVNGGVVRMG